jgi:ADP-heptose:LPS heptosyltransferase
VEKRWPADRFAALADRLVDVLSARLVLLGGPDDGPVNRSVVGAMGPAARARTLDVSGRLSLAETAAVIARCRLYVGNDSGVAHLAAAVGTPVVEVFGPTDPRRYGPVPGAGLAVAPPGAAVAHLADASGSRAIETVTVDMVWDAADELLKAEGSSG